MDHRHLVTKEVVRESLIAISYGVIDEIAYSPQTKHVTSVIDDVITDARNKTIDEMRLELISLASFEPLTDSNIDTSTVKA